MSGRLSVMLMLLVALALTLSLVAAVASNASAQDAEIPAVESGNWGRYIMPSKQDIQAAGYALPMDGVPKDCCITTGYGGQVSIIINLSASQNNHCLERPRWYCAESNGYYPPSPTSYPTP